MNIARKSPWYLLAQADREFKRLAIPPLPLALTPLKERELGRRAYEQLCRDVERREEQRHIEAEKAIKSDFNAEAGQIAHELRLTEHIRSGAWKNEAGQIVPPSPVTRWEDPTREQCSEGFQRLAWAVEEHVEFVLRHRHHDRPAALVRVLEHLGACPSDPTATLPADIEPELFLDLAMVTRQLWKDGGWRQHRDALELCLRTFRNSACALMTATEHETLNALPNLLQLYRGFESAVESPTHILHEAELEGIARSTSWTTSREIAEQFAVPSVEMFPFGYVASVIAPKWLVAAYFSDEREIIIDDPSKLPKVTIERTWAVRAAAA